MFSWSLNSALFSHIVKRKLKATALITWNGLGVGLYSIHTQSLMLEVDNNHTGTRQTSEKEGRVGDGCEAS